ncbi:response regulator transcription factor [Hydrogenobacter thermophilus]|uniref:response regulator transcription factor n=1 Tax=Hydrogenobacter thermophilus TaxID=940 RepID=UPI0030FBB0FC
MRLLLVEDDKSLGRLVKRGLEEAGYTVDWVSDGITAEEYIKSVEYKVIILDLMLPKRDGFDLLKIARGHGIKTPIIILTARGATEDKVKGLDLGADDYLSKPFAFEELLARIRALIRRSYGVLENRVSFSDVVVDLNTHRVFKSNREVQLTHMEWKLISLLVLNLGRPLSKTYLNEQLYGWNAFPDSNVVEVLISKLRKKLDPEGKYIKTIKGYGYLLSNE